MYMYSFLHHISVCFQGEGWSMGISGLAVCRGGT